MSERQSEGRAPPGRWPLLVRGRVVDARGVPVANATVAVRCWTAMGSHSDVGGWLRAELTRADGSFEYCSRGDSLLVARAVHAKHAVGFYAGLDRLPRDAGGVARCDIRLPAGVRVAPQVVDANGKPLAGATVDVEVDSDGAGVDWFEPRITAMADADGRVRLRPLRRRPYLLLVRQGDAWRGLPCSIDPRDGEQHPRLVVIDRPEDVEPAVAEFVGLVRSRQIQGRVLDARGNAVAGADVLCWSPPVSVAARTWTTSDGSYALLATVAARATLVASAVGHAFTLVDVEVPAGDGLWRQDLSLRHPAAVRGYVRDASGRPLAGAFVRALTRHGYWPAPRPLAASGVDGSYELTDLPPGRVSVRACGSGREVTVGASGVTAVDLVVESDGFA